ncbi:unnamed protein product [Calypogeia fissa]
MEADGRDHSWPQDMERRRVAALQKFQRNNPNYKVVYEQLHGTSQNRVHGEKCGSCSMSPLKSGEARKGRPGKTVFQENRWCLATTMELLDEMKAYLRANNLYCLGEDIEKWKTIASRLTNPCGLELRKLARSSMVRFDNLRRYFRAGRVTRMEVEVQESIIDYFQLCERQQPQGLKKSSIKPPSTMKLAVDYHRKALPSPQLTPKAIEKSHHKQISMHSIQPLHDDDDYSMSSLDDWSESSDGDDNGLSPVRGNSHPTSKNMGTLVRMPLPPPAAEIDSSDEEDGRKRYHGAICGMSRNRLRRTPVPKPSTPSALMKQHLSRSVKIDASMDRRSHHRVV